MDKLVYVKLTQEGNAISTLRFQTDNHKIELTFALFPSQLSFRTHFHNFISAYGSNDHRRSGQTAAAAVSEPRHNAKRGEEETKLHSTAKSD